MARVIHNSQHDDYCTPKYVWEDIKELLPKDKVIWEAFYCNGSSGTYLEELGFSVIHRDIDFFQHNEGDLVVSNPPFSKTYEILERLVHLDKPFVLILPAGKMSSQKGQRIIKQMGGNFQLIIPKKRIHFEKVADGKIVKQPNSCSFDCYYYCYKMNLKRDIMLL